MTRRRLRIVIFIPSLGGGGAERASVNLAGFLSDEGHHVELVLIQKRGPYVAEVPESVSIVDLKRARFWTSVTAFVRYAKKSEPDVILSQMPLANGITAIAKRLLNREIKIILVEQNAGSKILDPPGTLKPRVFAWMLGRTYRWADAVVAVSKGIARRLRRRLPRGVGERVVVIHNPVWSSDKEVLAREDVDHEWLRDDRTPVILSAGRLVPQKDYETAMRAVARVNGRRPVRWIILGEGDERAALHELAEGLGLEDRVSMVGFVSNPWAYMARSNVFLLSSLHEGFGNVIVEALGCGTPVVSTDCPSGPAEILRDGDLGTLVPVGDVSAMATAIERTLDAPSRNRETLRARARDFEVSRIGELYLRLMYDLLDARLDGVR